MEYLHNKQTRNYLSSLSLILSVVTRLSVYRHASGSVRSYLGTLIDWTEMLMSACKHSHSANAKVLMLNRYNVYHVLTLVC